MDKNVGALEEEVVHPRRSPLPAEESEDWSAEAGKEKVEVKSYPSSIDDCVPPLPQTPGVEGVPIVPDVNVERGLELENGGKGMGRDMVAKDGEDGRREDGRSRSGGWAWGLDLGGVGRREDDRCRELEVSWVSCLWLSHLVLLLSDPTSNPSRWGFRSRLFVFFLAFDPSFFDSVRRSVGRGVIRLFSFQFGRSARSTGVGQPAIWASGLGHERVLLPASCNRVLPLPWH
ncbi:hypothetical protein DFP72DRAFT_1105794 [Ephemerocybe angulata]|uniref:Uncharacterized protein n=1 Tax=Ephemerocybe angulata TaxID=980116 RepID=A0A8H6LUD2_9AGAR|nr:hypothetical protein DFP72DRAFT_1105794 [Tulosesus angulatus]